MSFCDKREIYTLYNLYTIHCIVYTYSIIEGKSERSKNHTLSLLNKKLGTLLMWPFSADFKGRGIFLTCAFVLVGLPRPDMHHKSEK